jgi:cob(I)alamin adenosyltransferase
MKIYTKTGDDGFTGLLGGERVSKHSLRMHAIGDVDELNASLGLCRTEAANSCLEPMLGRIQSWLFDLGAELASKGDGPGTYHAMTGQQSLALEADIDQLTDRMEPLKNFILPGGAPLSAQLHLARAICRRAERTVLTLATLEEVRTEATIFLNRLSDWLFVAARTANHEASVEDVKWSRFDD